MSIFARRRSEAENKSRVPAIESLESRAYFAATVVPATVTVTVPGPVPQQAVAGVVVNDRIAVSIANTDVNRARGRGVLTLFASTDATLSADDAQIQPPSVVGLNINPGHSKTFRINVKRFPQNLNGTYFIIAEVTGTGVNPGVGAGISTISIQQPQIDLADSVIKTPLNGHAGRRVPVTVQITNEGNTQAKGVLPVSFSVSATPDGASPFTLGSLSRRINLKPGKTAKLRFSVPLPLGVPTGNQFVVAVADPSNTFLDPNLLNNISVGQQPVTVT